MLGEAFLEVQKWANFREFGNLLSEAISQAFPFETKAVEPQTEAINSKVLLLPSIVAEYSAVREIVAAMPPL